MKRFSAVLIIGLLFSGFCFAQTQTGNATYNASKSGVTISHPSMSFGTRVRITNLVNNKEVIATVDGRIPTTDAEIADISKEAGDAIGMSPTGYTVVRLEHLVPQQTAPATVTASNTVTNPGSTTVAEPAAPAPVTSSSSSDTPAPVSSVVSSPRNDPVPAASPAAPPTTSPAASRASSPAASPATSPAASPATSPATSPAVSPAASGSSGSSPVQESVFETIEIVSQPQVQYVALPQNQYVSSPFCLAILILLIVIIILLTVILCLLLSARRVPWWLGQYPLWVKRLNQVKSKRRKKI